jgi:hypothetical protein
MKIGSGIQMLMEGGHMGIQAAWLSFKHTFVFFKREKYDKNECRRKGQRLAKISSIFGRNE